MKGDTGVEPRGHCPKPQKVCKDKTQCNHEYQETFCVDCGERLLRWYPNAEHTLRIIFDKYSVYSSTPLPQRWIPADTYNIVIEAILKWHEAYSRKGEG